MPIDYPRTPKFQRLHYEALADVFAKTLNDGFGSPHTYVLLHRLMDMLAEDNPNFRKDLFHDRATRRDNE